MLLFAKDQCVTQCVFLKSVNFVLTSGEHGLKETQYLLVTRLAVHGAVFIMKVILNGAYNVQMIKNASCY